MWCPHFALTVSEQKDGGDNNQSKEMRIDGLHVNVPVSCSIPCGTASSAVSHRVHPLLQAAVPQICVDPS